MSVPKKKAKKVCEWEKDKKMGWFLTGCADICFALSVFWVFCPYCGRKIKVVGGKQ